MIRYFLRATSVNQVEMGTVLIFAAILLHGVCYVFLFIPGQLYVDDEANERMRGAARGFIAFIFWGAGNFVGGTLAGKSQAFHTLAQSGAAIAHDWYGIWIYPAWGALAVLVVFAIFFRDPSKKTATMI